ncbi:peamaclein-like [Euphorbia lathyris]|uniref:peamaclein-like n=1 Tax=Euphorbia lathyris TaxID=212925 RepID=UPI0033141E92
MKVFLPITTLVLLISLNLVFTTMAASTPTIAPSPSNYCDMKCGGRCEKAGYKDRCIKYCGICCKECKCVPSGTYGNKSECPCYRDKKNSKGYPKCP